MSDDLATTAHVTIAESRRWYRRLADNKLSLVVAILVVCLVVVALCSSLIAPFDAMKPAGMPMEPPSRHHLLGTDEIGRDVFSRILIGSRVSLYVGLGATAIAMLLGVPLGMISGYFGRFIDSVLMRAVDGMLAFPPIILAMATVAVLGPNLRNTIIAIGVVQIPRFARQSRALTSSLREREFVQASRVLGGSHVHVMLRTLLPNMAPIVLVQASLTFATAVLTEAALSFLGLGTQPPRPSWGGMLSSGKTLLSLNPWIAIGAGSAIFCTVLLFTLLGDTFSDLFNPHRSRG
jgi:peptide/nickel transport system permease protein